MFDTSLNKLRAVFTGEEYTIVRAIFTGKEYPTVRAIFTGEEYPTADCVALLALSAS